MNICSWPPKSHTPFSNSCILFSYYKVMSKHMYDFLGYLKARRGERLSLWLWKLLLIATEMDSLSASFLPGRKTSIPGELPLQLHWGKAGVLFISSLFLLLRNQLCEFCGHQINSYTLLSLRHK